MRKSMARPLKALAFLVLIGACVAHGFEPPKGWKMPVDSSFDGAWRKASPARYLSMGLDIDCDGYVDSAVILQPDKGLGIGLFVFLQDSAGGFKPKLVFDSRKDVAELKGLSEKEKKKIQFRYSSFYGIKAAARGIYPTACGQGYRPCERGERRKIEIECGGIDFFPSDQEGGNMDIYWDRKSKKILRALMND
jgi:hypothetical protein